MPLSPIQRKLLRRKSSCLVVCLRSDIWYRWIPDYLWINIRFCSVVRVEGVKDHRSSGHQLRRELFRDSCDLRCCSFVVWFCGSEGEERTKEKQRGCEQNHYLRKILSVFRLCLSQTETNPSLPPGTIGNPNPLSSIKGHHRASTAVAPVSTLQEESPLLLDNMRNLLIQMVNKQNWFATRQSGSPYN